MPSRRTIYRFAFSLAIISAILAAVADHAPSVDLSAPSRAGPAASGLHSPTLREILASLEAATGVQIVVDPDVADVEAINIDIAGQEPEAVLRLLLADYDVRMQYLPGQGTAAGSLERVWVRAPGHDADARPTDAAADSVRVPGVQLSPEHQAATGAGVDEIAPDPVAQLARDLTDADENVRQQALFAAAGSGDPLPRHTLEQLLSYDPSELARRSALEALNVHPEVDPGTLHALLLRAQRDPSPLVRESAAAIAEGLATPADAPVDYDPADTPDTDAGDLIQAPDTEEPPLAVQ